jgi:hypothetical protein
MILPNLNESRTKVRQVIQLEQNRVRAALSAADPGSAMPGVAVSRLGTAAIPITGLAATVSAWFSSPSLEGISIQNFCPTTEIS